MKRALLIALLLGSVLFIAVGSCLAQQSLEGTYKMVGVQRVLDGKPEAQPTKPPHRYLIITPKVFALFYTDGVRKAGASEKEKAELSVDTSRNEVYNGTQQTRNWELQGNRLNFCSAPRPWGRDPSKTVAQRQEWEKIE
jgi:hypothetical protein